MNRLKNKGFTTAELPNLIIVLGVFAVVLGVMATIIDNMQDSMTDNTLSSLADSNLVTMTNKTTVFFGDYDSESREVPCGTPSTIWVR